MAFTQFISSFSELIKNNSRRLTMTNHKLSKLSRCVSDSQLEKFINGNPIVNEPVVEKEVRTKAKPRRKSVTRSHSQCRGDTKRDSLPMAFSGPSTASNDCMMPAFGRRLSVIHTSNSFLVKSNQSISSMTSRRHHSGSFMKNSLMTQKSLIRDIWDAELSLITLAMSMFFYISANRLSPFLILNGLILMPLFVGITSFLSFWVALFVLAGRIFVIIHSGATSAHELEDDWLTERAESVVSSSGISSMASHELLNCEPMSNGVSNNPLLYYSSRKVSG